MGDRVIEKLREIVGSKNVTKTIADMEVYK